MAGDKEKSVQPQKLKEQHNKEKEAVGLMGERQRPNNNKLGAERALQKGDYRRCKQQRNRHTQ